MAVLSGGRIGLLVLLLLLVGAAAAAGVLTVMMVLRCLSVMISAAISSIFAHEQGFCPPSRYIIIIIAQKL
jgi:hypothetical protein